MQWRGGPGKRIRAQNRGTPDNEIVSCFLQFYLLHRDVTETGALTGHV